MVSHKKLSGIELTLGKGGLRFKKRKSRYNICIGKELKDFHPPDGGGRYSKDMHDKFKSAVRNCKKDRQSPSIE